MSTFINVLLLISVGMFLLIILKNKTIFKTQKLVWRYYFLSTFKKKKDLISIYPYTVIFRNFVSGVPFQYMDNGKYNKDNTEKGYGVYVNINIKQDKEDLKTKGGMIFSTMKYNLWGQHRDISLNILPPSTSGIKSSIFLLSPKTTPNEEPILIELFSISGDDYFVWGDKKYVNVKVSATGIENATEIFINPNKYCSVTLKADPNEQTLKWYINGYLIKQSNLPLHYATKNFTAIAFVEPLNENCQIKNDKLTIEFP